MGPVDVDAVQRGGVDDGAGAGRTVAGAFCTALFSGAFGLSSVSAMPLNTRDGTVVMYPVFRSFLRRHHLPNIVYTTSLSRCA